MDFIPINLPWVGEEELALVKERILSHILTNANYEGGEMVRRFEEALSKVTGSRFVVAVNSGSSAILISLLALDVGPGDEVIVPSFTFLSVANMVLLLGAKPVFADIRLEDYGLDPRDVKEKMSDKTKAVILTHLYGHVARIEEILEIAENRGVEVIEDSAQALGTTLKGRQVGCFGAMGCFSTYPTKIITTGEGGFITTNREELAEKARLIRTHGQREAYRSEVLGGNFRLPEILAAIGVAQLERLPEILRLRRRNAEILTGLLEDTDLILPREGEGERFNWNLYTVRVRKGDRDGIVEGLRRRDIGASIYYKYPIHLSPIYQDRGYKVSLPRTELASKTVFSLPIHPLVTEEQIHYISDTLHSLLGKG